MESEWEYVVQANSKAQRRRTSGKCRISSSSPCHGSVLGSLALILQCSYVFTLFFLFIHLLFEKLTHTHRHEAWLTEGVWDWASVLSKSPPKGWCASQLPAKYNSLLQCALPTFKISSTQTFRRKAAHIYVCKLLLWQKAGSSQRSLLFATHIHKGLLRIGGYWGTFKSCATARPDFPIIMAAVIVDEGIVTPDVFLYFQHECRLDLQQSPLQV